MTRDEIRASVEDLLELSLTDSQITETLLARVNGIDLRLVIAALLSAARERRDNRIAELEQELEDAAFDRDELESDLENLDREFDGLMAEVKDLRR